MATFLTQLPTPLVILLVTSFCVGLAVDGLLVVRRVVPHPVLREHNDVAGFIFAALGVIYAVILAFVVIAVWETYEEYRDNINEEAALAANLDRELAAFNEPDRIVIRDALRAYIANVIEDEWPLMEDGKPSAATEEALLAL